MLRLLHTSDWHLGHKLHDLPRDYEHDAFLAWLLDQLQIHRVDALVIAGDIFDQANPPTDAVRRFFRFVGAARRAMPQLDMVIVGGNHDSAARLDAPQPVLDALGVHVVGGLPKNADGTLDPDRLLVELKSADTTALLIAMPYLRTGDLPAPRATDEPDFDSLIDGVTQRYQQALELALARRKPRQPLVATGHIYMAGTKLSELSERKILGGNQHALPARILGKQLSYAALGHLHKAQEVGCTHFRYSGSPIPLSLTEAPYTHQVLLVDLDGPGPATVTPLPIPRAVEILRLPEDGPAPLPEVLARLALLPAMEGQDPDTLPFLEVQVAPTTAQPALRQRIHEAIAGKAVRLLRIARSGTGTGVPLAQSAGTRDLDEFTPEGLFLRLWDQAHQEPAPDALLAAFHDLVELTRAGATTDEIRATLGGHA